MTRIIGIAGASGSGKSTLAQTLARDLGGVLIAEDDYYHCSSGIAGFDADAYDFDGPEAKDMARLAADLTTLRSGQPVVKPRYDFVTHRRMAQTETVAPADIVIVEGILALSDKRVRACYDLAIWIDTPPDICLLRRVRRDVAERGRSLDSVLNQYERTVRPAFLAHAARQRASADLVFDEPGGFEIGDMVARVRARLRAA